MVEEKGNGAIRVIWSQIRKRQEHFPHRICPRNPFWITSSMQQQYMLLRQKKNICINAASEGMDGIESGGAGSDPLAERVGDGEGDGGGRDPTHPLGPLQLPVVQLSLFWASGGKQNGIPRWNPTRVSHRQPQMVPWFPQKGRQVLLLFHPPPPLTPLHLTTLSVSCQDHQSSKINVNSWPTFSR